METFINRFIKYQLILSTIIAFVVLGSFVGEFFQQGVFLLGSVFILCPLGIIGVLFLGVAKFYSLKRGFVIPRNTFRKALIWNTILILWGVGVLAYAAYALLAWTSIGIM
jgi:hypothetical protein